MGRLSDSSLSSKSSARWCAKQQIRPSVGRYAKHSARTILSADTGRDFQSWRVRDEQQQIIAAADEPCVHIRMLNHGILHLKVHIHVKPSAHII